MEKINLKQTAEKLFADTAHKVLWANQKGEFFTSENLGTLSLKEGQKLTKFERAEEKVIIEPSTDKKELNANDTIAVIKAATSLEAIKEFENDERKSVKLVYDWKVKSLTAAINVLNAIEVGSKEAKNGNEDTEGKK